MQALVANRQRTVPVRPATLRRAAIAAMSAEGCPPGSETSVAVVSDRQIRALNRRYLGRDRSTDVLAFPQDLRKLPLHGRPRKGAKGTGPGLLGDVVVSAERAAAQAPRYGQTVERELELLVIHGVLHLLGYDDTTPRARSRMHRRQRVILASLHGGTARLRARR
ncbi:MAG TPA: rRNA maturation RNase YbeY [bacterium]|jgi:probable rRNA maturation factor|nr:rRNA maturation RNase YbeY [bacterium]